MGKIKLCVILLALFVSQAVDGKSPGNYKSHHQITDKEVLFETTKGVKILISAQDDYAIGVNVFNKGEVVSLTTPEQIRSKSTSLKGSIYVEEIKDAIQVTTTMSDGLYIRIEKNPFRLSYIQKENYTTLASESNGFGFDKSGLNVSFAIDSQNEELELVSISSESGKSHLIEKGKVKETIEPNVALVSSRGYSLAFNGDFKKIISLSKNNELAIQSTNDEAINNFGYVLMFGPSHVDFIGKYVVNNVDHESVTTLF